MKRSILKYIPVVIMGLSLASCLKNNNLYESYDSLQPVADLPKAKANALTSTTPTNSYVVLDTTAGGVDYPTAVHISSNDHVGDVVVRMRIDKAAAQTWVTANAGGYQVLPDSLYTIASMDVTVPNAGVFSTGDFIIRIKSNAKNAGGVNVFKANKFILPVSIDKVVSASYGVAENFRTILWYIRVK